MTEQPLSISTHGLKFSFNRHQVLKGIDLEVPAKSIYGFLGANGAGKSTFIKSLLGLLKVKPEQIRIFDLELSSNRLKILSKIGSMIEEPAFYGHLSGFQNLEMIRKLHNLPSGRSEEVLEIIGLDSEANKKVRNYSSGMKQRLGIACALLSKPDLLILDEPINGLDPLGIIEIRKLLSNLNEEFGTTIFLSSHLLSEIEKLCTHIAIIDKGKLVFQDTMKNLQAVRTDMIIVSITCDNSLKAQHIPDPDQFMETKNNQLIIKCKNNEEIARIIQKLVSENIKIYEVKAENRDLENNFIHLISN